MDLRIYKIARIFLSQTDTSKVLSDKEINKILKDNIEEQYSILINGQLRRLDLDKLIFSTFYLAHKLPGTGHTEELDVLFSSLKSRLLLTLENEFNAEKGSLKDQLFQEVKQNPDFNEDDVVDLVKKSLLDRRKEMITFLRKLNIIVSQ